jgi:hypothetical protein
MLHIALSVDEMSVMKKKEFVEDKKTGNLK